jgi:dihydrofolate reductase
MKPFTAIAAMSLNRVIGNGNQIPWHLPEDFKWFKATTTGQVIVMGRKTFESIGKPLPNRETIVLSRSAFAHPGVRTMRDLSELLAWAKSPSPGLSASISVNREGTLNIEHSTSNVQGRTPGHSVDVGSSMLNVECSRGLGQRQVFICGGAQIYEQALPLCSELFLTLVKREVAGDAFFPKFEDQFELAEEIRDTPEFKILRYCRRTG